MNVEKIIEFDPSSLFLKRLKEFNICKKYTDLAFINS